MYQHINIIVYMGIGDVHDIFSKFTDTNYCVKCLTLKIIKFDVI